MHSTILYTYPQWFILAALFSIIYARVEKKKVFSFIGLAIFILLGIFSATLIAKGYFATNPNELGKQPLQGIPIKAKLLPAYWSFILAAVFAIPAMLLIWKKKKYAKFFMVLTAITSLLGFFIIVGVIRSI